METITVYYSPLEATRIVEYVGLGLAHHIGIVYTNSAGQSFGVSSGPSIQSTQQTPPNALRAILRQANNEPSDFGTLISDPHNNTPFVKSRMDDYYTQDYMGKEFPHSVAAQGNDLSAKWATIVKTYAAAGSMHLTYSPVSQNSNSMAGEALRRAGIRVPFSVDSRFAPGVFTHLPVFKCEMQDPTPARCRGVE
jgi:hypothetical protein